MVTEPTGGARAVARCDFLGEAPYSDTPGMLFRSYLSPAFARTQEAIGGWMAAAGMRVSLDAAANLVGRYDGTDANAPALLIGSHIDSVRDAGRYDGPLGVMLGIECVATLHAAGRRMPFAVEVIAFGDEEGSRFPASMLTSRAVAGTLDPAALQVADAGDVALTDALTAFGCNAADYHRAARPPGSVLAYLEAHIEQGPVLEAEDLPVGIVTGIAAQLRFRIEVTGTAGHAGTTTMALRRDALTGTAEMVLAAEIIARADDSDLVATVGAIAAQPGAANVIPGAVTFTLDVRSGDQGRRDAAADAMLEQFRTISDARGLGIVVEQVNDLPPSPCDRRLSDLLADAVREHGIVPRRLVSGAGHDAMIMAALCPTAMLFIRCAGGVSHNPAEAVEVRDVEIALAAMRGFIDRLGASCAA